MSTRSARRPNDPVPGSEVVSGRISRLLDDFSSRRLRWVAVTGLPAAFVIDWLTGPTVSVLFLYSVACALMTWAMGLRLGIVAAGTASLLASLVHELHPDAVSGTMTILVNATLRMLALALVVWVVDLQRSTLRRLELTATTDALTGLLNRAGLMKQLHLEATAAQRRCSPLTIAFFDLDGLKKRNDDHGHDAGDRYLQRFASIVSDALSPHGILGRVGGDEFVAVVPDAGPNDARRIFNRIAALPRLPTVSIGVVTVQAEFPEELDSILRRADTAMYEAKHHSMESIVFAPINAVGVEAAAISGPRVAGSRTTDPTSSIDDRLELDA